MTRDNETLIQEQLKLRDAIWPNVRQRLDYKDESHRPPRTPEEMDLWMREKLDQEGLDEAAGVHFHDLRGILVTLETLGYVEL